MLVGSLITLKRKLPAGQLQAKIKIAFEVAVKEELLEDRTTWHQNNQELSNTGLRNRGLQVP